MEYQKMDVMVLQSRTRVKARNHCLHRSLERLSVFFSFFYWFFKSALKEKNASYLRWRKRPIVSKRNSEFQKSLSSWKSNSQPTSFSIYIDKKNNSFPCRVNLFWKKIGHAVVRNSVKTKNYAQSLTELKPKLKTEKEFYSFIRPQTSGRLCQ